MADEHKENEEFPLKADEKQLDPGLPDHVIDQFAGDSIDELRRQEVANQHFAQKEIDQNHENA